MSMPILNPFDDLIDKEPRLREPVVRGLNDQPAKMLFERFEALAAGSAPREMRRSGDALLVTAAQPGYGKSHLIGRLFRELNGRATLVYVRPFQNAATVFQSLMLTIVRELSFPDRAAETGGWDRDEPTQLDHFAHAVLAHLVADILESGKGVKSEVPEERAEVVRLLREDPLGAFNRGVSGSNWADWMRSHFIRLLPLLDQALARRGLALTAPVVWVRVLHAYTFSPPRSPVRAACVDWMTAVPLEPADLESIGLRSTESVNPEIDPAEASQICRSRLADLCQLAVFFRPLIFCFDQTEIYGQHPALARTFGMVLGRLVDEAANHLTLVTCNQEPWHERIQKHIEKADLNRISQPPLALQGLDRSQAEELARLRLEAADVEFSRKDAFLSHEWLSQLFPTATQQMGARPFLQKCRDRWNKAPTRPSPLPELFQQYCRTLLASPSRHFFEPDVLQWVVEDAAKGIPGLTVDRSDHKYLSVSWQTANRLCYFGFIGGAHWKQWRSIAQAVVMNCRGNSRPAKTVFFRTPEQQPIPAPNWKNAAEIEIAKAKYLQLICLNLADLVELYAARELFADAAQGDIAFSTAEVSKFLHQQLASWWERLMAPIEKENGVEKSQLRRDDLAREVRKIVQSGHRVSVEEAQAKVSAAKATPEEILEACGYSAEIRIHTSADATVLQWTGN